MPTPARPTVVALPRTTRRRSLTLLTSVVSVATASAVAWAAGPAGSASAAPGGPPAVVQVGQAARQDVTPLPGSEPDTLVEPDVAVSPLDPGVAIAVSHDGRYPDGGAVGIETAWTHDGGHTWQHQPLPGVTSSTGGPARWARASDPVVAFAADGSAYVSVLVFDTGCNSGVLVSRSTDGGRTWGAPSTAHRSTVCEVSDDKNWLVVDTQPGSPHAGRLYQFWTPFYSDAAGHPQGSPQLVTWSDDHAATWSAPVPVTPPHVNSQDSQPMVLPDGTLVDSYLDYGTRTAGDGSEAWEAREAAKAAAPEVSASSAAPQARGGYPVLKTRISHDGGATWGPGGVISHDVGPGPSGIRCCLASATADPVTGMLYATWNPTDRQKVDLSSSRDGVTWSSPVVVDVPTPGRQTVSSDVAAYDGLVSVAFGLTNSNTTAGRYAQQYVVTSYDKGRSFGAPVAVGPRSDYAFAAVAGGIFPGDYIGAAMTAGRIYAVWMVSSRPPDPTALYHQVMWAATLRP